MTPSKLTLVLIVALAIVMFFCAPFIIRQFSGNPLPVYGSVTDFSLTDSQSKPFTQKDIEGKIWVADFIFTSCPGECKLMTQDLAKIYRSYELEPDVHMVSFTVDPDRDTPQVLSDYAKEHNANPQKWHFLTGPIDAIHKLSVDGFKIGTLEDPLFHSERFVLVDKKMRVRGYYDYNERSDIKKLFQDVAILLKEKP